MSEALKITPHQASDVEAASEAVYSQAADQLLQTATLGRDLLALLTIFLIVVTYHLQNPLLQFGVPLGQAFRNASLQPILVLAMVIGSAIMVGNPKRLRAHWLRLTAAVVLGLYAFTIVFAILFRFNIFGVLVNVPQAAFLRELKDETLQAAMQSALTISTIFEYLALLAVVMLWQPWTRLALYRRAVIKNLPVLLVAIAVLIVWEMVINLFNIQQFLLPRPSVIGAKFIEIYPRLVPVSWNTFQNAFWGFCFGCGLGIVTGLISSRFTSFSRALLPLAIAANSVPIIAFAPIFNNWFGPLSPLSKIAIVAVLTYFPAMISTVRGLSSADPLSVELMKSYAATEWEIFRKLRLPSALPFIFSALKVGTTLSMIGAIVSEYFGGSNQGLGYRIREDAALFRYSETWSAIIVASLLGILFYLLVSVAERWIMPWQVSLRED
jgi:NitT/TauT family transport system permease protein